MPPGTGGTLGETAVSQGNRVSPKIYKFMDLYAPLSNQAMLERVTPRRVVFFHTPKDAGTDETRARIRECVRAGF